MVIYIDSVSECERYMVENYFVETRRKNKMQFFDYVKEHKDEWETPKILAMYSFQTGFRKSTLETWLDELVEAGLLNIVKGKRWDLTKQ